MASSFLGLFLAALSAAFAMLLVDPQWVKSHSWLLPMLLTLSAVFGFAALAYSPWLRRKFAGSEREPIDRVSQSVHGSGNRQAGRDYHEHNYAPRFLKEVPAGVRNGINREFTLTYSPNPADSLDVTLNGQGQEGWYTLNGRVITFKVAPKARDEMSARYTY